jgi:hypothetical protein
MPMRTTNLYVMPLTMANSSTYTMTDTSRITVSCAHFSSPLRFCPNPLRWF